MIEFREPLDSLIRDPRSLTGGKRFAQKINIYDETLRDGEQMPGIAFTPSQKVQLATLLSEMGVDVLMAAYPGASVADQEACLRVLQARKGGAIRRDVEIMCIARANNADINAVVEVAHQAHVPMEQVGILLLSTSSDLHIKYKMGRILARRYGLQEERWLDTPVEWFRKANIDFIVEKIEYCRQLGFGEVEFASEDASRGSREYLVDLARECQQAGGTRLCFSDTNGVLTPEGVDYYFSGLTEELPGLAITAHFHNDFGMAAINTVRALAHGATHASVTACGIGERAGNASIHQVVMILKELYGVEIPDFRYRDLWQLRDLVEVCSGVPIQPHEPIIGYNVFSHESGIHTAGISTHPRMYQALDHELVGGEHRTVFGKHSGVQSLRSFTASHHDCFSFDPRGLSTLQYEMLLQKIKAERERATIETDHSSFIESYYRHLENLGVPEWFVIEQIEVLGNELAVNANSMVR